MPKQITPTTKRFKEQVEELENTGAVKNRQEIIDKIGWNKTGMSLAMQLKDNIPPYVYAEFIKVYNLKTDINNKGMEQTDTKSNAVPAIEHIALQRKHIELQEKHIALLEKQTSNNTPLQVQQIHEMLTGIVERQQQRTSDVEMLRKEILENRETTTEFQKDIQSYLHTLYRWSVPHFAKAAGVPFEQLRNDMDTYLASLLNEGA